jgi:hypothetical protein
MSEKTTENSFSNPFSGDWMKTASKFWDDTLKLQSEAMTVMSGCMGFLMQHLPVSN